MIPFRDLLPQNLFFRKLGEIIYHCPKTIVTMIFFICILSFTGLHKLKFEDNFRDGFFLKDSKSVEEHRIFSEFLRPIKMPYMMALIGECTQPGCSMLEDENFEIFENETLKALNQLHTMKQFNRTYHYSLQHLVTFSSEYHFFWLKNYVKSSNKSDIVLNYPYIVANSAHIPIHYNIFRNGINQPFNILYYSLIFSGVDPLHLSLIKKAELVLYEQLKNRQNLNVNIYLLGDHLVDYEIGQASFSTLHYFSAGTIAMILTVFFIIRHYKQSETVNIILTVTIICCPLFAGIITFCIFSFMGIAINSTMMITPFLVLGVGVDDAFLIMRSWFYSTSAGLDRINHVFSTIGPSITLSSTTNIVAFLMGHLMSPSEDIARFCLSSATAFAICWVLELLILVSHLQILCPERIPSNATRRYNVPEKFFDTYSKFLNNPSFVHCVIFLVLLSLLGGSIWTAVNMEEDFSPEKTFDEHSFLAKSLASLNKIYSDHQIVRIITELPVSVYLFKKNIREIKMFRHACKDFPIWLDIYDSLYQSTAANMDEYLSYLRNFYKLYPGTGHYVRLYKSEFSTVRKISFDFCLKGSKTWHERAYVVNNLRKILPEGYSMYFYDSHILDLILSIKGTIFKAIMITVLIMAIICTQLLPEKKISSCTVFSLASATIFVIGGLYLWGAELDMVFMVNIVMVAGFSVDYLSHISYHLYRKRGRNEVEHMKKTLQLISGPSAQAALTTIACVIPLLFHDVYMYVVFAKTVVLCSIFGFLHATFVMPLLFSSVERLFTFISSDNHPISLVSSQIALNLIPSRQRRQNSGEGSQAQPRRPTVDDDYQETTSV